MTRRIPWAATSAISRGDRAARMAWSISCKMRRRSPCRWSCSAAADSCARLSRSANSRSANSYHAGLILDPPDDLRLLALRDVRVTPSGSPGRPSLTPRRDSTGSSVPSRRRTMSSPATRLRVELMVDVGERRSHRLPGDDFVNRPADGFFGRPAVHRLGRTIPARDAPVGVQSDHGLGDMGQHIGLELPGSRPSTARTRMWRKSCWRGTLHVARTAPFGALAGARCRRAASAQMRSSSRAPPVRGLAAICLSNS